MPQLKIITTVLVLAAAASSRPDHAAAPAAPQITYGAPPPSTYVPPSPETAKPVYSFNWAVKDDYGNDFGHQESRDGYDTQGFYYVLLPDSRTEKVSYTVSGDSGFVATVVFEGEAKKENHFTYEAEPLYIPPSNGPTHPPAYVNTHAPAFR